MTRYLGLAMRGQLTTAEAIEWQYLKNANGSIKVALNTIDRIITVIMNNRVLGNVRQWQTMFYGSRYSQTDPHRKTDYVKLADAFGAVGYRASNIAELREALRKAQQSDGPVLIDCQIDKDERVLPMIPAGGTIDDLVTD